MRQLNLFRNVSFTLKLKLKLFFWLFSQSTIIPIITFNNFRRLILNFFGARIGSRVKFRRGVRILYPKNLEIGDDCWIGEEVWFINHEKVIIGKNVCISQSAIICSGGHDYRSVSLAYQHAPITIGDGAWVCLDAKVLPGTRIGKGSVIAAGEVARGDIPDFHMLIGGKLKAIEPPNRP